jgi:hypothetical protein
MSECKFCGVDLATLHPQANIAGHLDGTCQRSIQPVRQKIGEAKIIRWADDGLYARWGELKIALHPPIQFAEGDTVAIYVERIAGGDTNKKG